MLIEQARLAALAELQILDTPAETRFDRFTRLAAMTFDVPIALVSLIDAERQWFKSHHGLDMSETPRSLSFCSHAVQARAMLVIEDRISASTPDSRSTAMAKPWARCASSTAPRAA
jgi:GAF domain-containing protein